MILAIVSPPPVGGTKIAMIKYDYGNFLRGRLRGPADRARLMHSKKIGVL
jgi:hypothetical protein